MLPSKKQWLVRVFHKGANDPQGRIIHKEIVDLGITTVEKVVTMPTYIISGFVDKESIEKVCIELLTDPITQSYTLNGGFQEQYDWAIEVWPKDGVIDFVAGGVKKGLRLLITRGVV